MSKFLSKEASRLAPYTPGEQPQDQQYVKLNTNESPFPPSPKVVKAISRAELLKLNLYSDPTCGQLVQALAKRYELQPENVITGNGSDEILAFAFRAFCGEGKPLAYADITYGFYKSQVALFGLKAKVIPLREDFTLNVDDYMDFPGTIVIANPNAPTGIALPLSEVEKIIASNPDRVVVIDEAYVDFGGESAAGLIDQYDNLLVVMTYSKSRSMAGARLGFALASRPIIQDLEKIKYSTNPYNVNRLTLKLGEAAVDSDAYFRDNAKKIMATREKTAKALRALGFTLPDSKANFLFVKKEGLDGGLLYQKLKDRGILIRHFSDPRIAQYNRVTVGTDEEMEAFLEGVKEIMAEEGLA